MASSLSGINKAINLAKFADTTRQAFQSRPFQIFLIVVIVIAVIYFAGKKAGKEAAQDEYLAPKPLPNSGQGVPTNWEPQRDAIVKELYEIMTSTFATDAAKNTVWSKLSYITDDQLTAIYNEFNRLYANYEVGIPPFSAKAGTLYQWINDEMLSFWSDSNIKTYVLNKMSKLGLT